MACLNIPVPQVRSRMINQCSGQENIGVTPFPYKMYNKISFKMLQSYEKISM